MTLVQINWDPSRRQLRQFALVCLAVLPLLGWWWGVGSQAFGVLVGIGLVAMAAAILVPTALKPVYVGLSLITAPIGLVVSELVLLVLFFGLFVPLGLLFRLLGRDALALRRDPKADSYWREKKQPRSVASYFRQS